MELIPCCSLRGLGHATTGEGRISEGVGVGACNTAVFVVAVGDFVDATGE